MNIKIEDKIYEVKLIDGSTKDDIVSMLPIDIKLSKFDNHEYSGSLPNKPRIDNNKTSDIYEGHIYYWDGWNSFVINYEDLNISPYKVIHIGEVIDKSIVDYLKNCEDEISVRLEKNNEK